MVSFPQVLKYVACPVDGCPERSHNPGRLRNNFMYRHWKVKIAILQEGPATLPRYYHCGMHIPAAQLWRHKWTTRCDRSMDMFLRWREVEMVERSGKIKYSFYGREGGTWVEGGK